MERCPCATLSGRSLWQHWKRHVMEAAGRKSPLLVCVLPWVVQHNVDVLEKGHTSKQREAFSQFFQKSDILGVLATRALCV